MKTISCLFLDIGGVLLTNGWGHGSRRAAADYYKIDFNEMEERHHLTFDTFEEGKLTLNEYLERVVFYEKRSFAPVQFQDFMFDQTTPYPEMIEFIKKLKQQYQLKIVVVNNEARELNEHRIKKFQLDQFVDFFISSCFVHYRKPDTDIFQIALDIAQVPAENVVYIDDREMFVNVAQGIGITSIHHTDYLSTSKILADLGLPVRQENIENASQNTKEVTTNSAGKISPIGVACDHGGFDLKVQLLALLKTAGFEVQDFGAYQLNNGDDFPDFVIPLSNAVSNGEIKRGIAICGSGVGACIAANKIAGVRSALITDSFSAHQGVEDDNMNIMCLGGRITGSALAWELVQIFINAGFKDEERFLRRLNKVKLLEKNKD